jgi:hypothetical protein
MCFSQDSTAPTERLFFAPNSNRIAICRRSLNLQRLNEISAASTTACILS